MQLHSCDAAGATFSLAVVDGAEPAAVQPLLAAMKASVAANIGGRRPRPAFRAARGDAEPASALLRAAPAGCPTGGRSPAQRPFSSTAFASTRRRRSEKRCPEDAIRSFFAAIKVTG